MSSSEGSLSNENEALRRTILMLRAVAEGSGHVFFIKDLAGRYLFCNSAITRVTGIQPENYLGRDDVELFGTPEARELQAQDRQVIATGLPNTKRHTLTIDGKPTRFQSTKLPFRDTDGVIRGVVGIAHVISSDGDDGHVDVSNISGSANVGPAYFRELVESLSRTCGVRIAAIAELDVDDSNRANTHALFLDGRLADNFSYDIRGTPCENVLRNDFCFYPSGVQAKFPEDVMLVDLGIDGYMGMPLFTETGRVIGLITLLHGTTFPDADQARAALQVAAVRAAAELERFQSVRKLRAEEDRLKTFVENTTDAYFLHYPNGQVYDVNRRACELLGYEPHEIIGHMPDFFDINATPERSAALHAEFQRQPELGFETQYRRKDGGRIDVEVRIRPFQRAQGRCALSTVRDITDRKRADAIVERRMFELHFLNEVGVVCNTAATLDEVIAGVTRLTADKLFPDNCGIVLYDATRTNLVPHPSLVVTNPDIVPHSLPVGVGVIGRTMRTGRSQRVPNVACDADYFPSDTRSRSELCVPIAGDDDLVGAINIESVALDAFSEADERLMTAVADLVGGALRRLRREAELRDEETRYRTMLESLPIGVFVHDGVTLFYANPEARRILGVHDAHGLIGLDPMSVVAPEYRELARRRVEAIIHRGEVLEPVEARILRFDGGEVDVDVTSLRTRYQGRDCVQVQFYDITARKRAEADVRRSISQLTATFEASTDGILVVDLQGRIVDFNRRFLEVWRFPEEMIARGRKEDLLPLLSDDRGMQEFFGQLKDPQAFARRVQEIYQTPEASSFDVIEFCDGRMVERTSQPQRIDGAPIGRVWAFRDVTARHRAEIELRRTADLLQAIAAGTPDAIFVKDLFGKYLLFNEAASRFVGKPISAVLGKTDLEVFEGDSAARLMENDRRVMLSGQISIHEERLTAAGITRTYLSTKGPYRDHSGTTIGLIGISHDITNRKQAEEIIRESEARHRLLMDSIPAYVSYIDADERYCWANHLYEEWYQLPREKIFGKTVAELQTPERYAAIQPHIRQALAGERVRYENAFARTDGTMQFFDTQYLPHRDEAGKVLGFFVLVYDITSEREAQAAVRESEAKYRQLFESSADAIFLIDFEGRIRSANPAAVRMHGFSLEELVGMRIPELDTQSDAALVPERTERLRAGESLNFEVTHRRKDGTAFPLEVAATTIQVGGERLILGIDRDISARKLLEEQLRQAQKLEAVGRLAGGVAHDFNNLLTVINGYAELLSAEFPEGDPRRESLSAIRDAGDRAATLISQLLAFSRKAIIEPKVLDLNRVTESVARILQRLIGEDVRLALDLSPSLDRIRIDPGQLEQVLINLAVNARDAMPRGGALKIASQNLERFTLSAPQGESPLSGRCVQLTVTDTGEGMTPEVRERLFEPFFTTKDVGKGTGLGLATVYGIIRQAGGTIEVESDVGRGTTFRIQFPAVPEGATLGGEKRGTDSIRGNETILLVEDETDVRRFTRRILEARGYRVLEAASGMAALETAAACREPIRLLLTDVVMPQLGGRELAEKLRAERPDTSVLYISGYTDDMLLLQGVESTHEAFLQKPFTPQALCDKVRKILDATC